MVVVVRERSVEGKELDALMVTELCHVFRPEVG
jgi:hypothetical protein